MHRIKNLLEVHFEQAPRRYILFVVTSGDILANEHIIEYFSPLYKSSLTWIYDMGKNDLYSLS